MKTNLSSRVGETVLFFYFINALHSQRTALNAYYPGLFFSFFNALFKKLEHLRHHQGISEKKIQTLD